MPFFFLASYSPVIIFVAHGSGESTSTCAGSMIVALLTSTCACEGGGCWH